MLDYKPKVDRKSSVIEVANYFLSQYRYDERWNITNYKLQSLVYYAQGWSLALRNKAMFHNKLEAWDYGVVCPDLYRVYGKYNFREVIPQSKEESLLFNDDDRDLLIAVWSKYGSLDTDRLRFMAANELPWKNAWSNMKKGKGRIITNEELQFYFQSLLVKP